MAGLVCFAMALAVAGAHSKTGILAPAMTGDAYLERCIRAHTNTLEGGVAQTCIFDIPGMWV
jgi:glutathione S-transferase